jgi:subtilisin family serine protease
MSFVALMTGVFFAADAGATGPGYQYHFFKEARPLTLDATRVALLSDTARANGEPRWRGGDLPGVDEVSARARAIRGWDLAPVEEPLRTTAGVEQVVDQIARSGNVTFVSPVFVGDDGGAMHVTPDILVRFDRGVAPRDAEAVLAAFPGIVVERKFGNMAGAYRLRSASRNGFDVLAAANRFARSPGVRFAEPDVVFSGRAGFIPDDTLFGSLWGLNNTGQSGGTVDMDMDAPEAWDITTGDPSIVVAVFDVGVQQDHPDLNQIPGTDVTDDPESPGDGGPANVCDVHGTAVAGCVSAAINNNLGVVGSSPDCRSVSVRPFISNVPCDGTWDSISSWTVNALAWAETTAGARVSNNSNYYGFQSSAIADKYAETRDNGMVHFASAGNFSEAIITYPSSLPSVNAIAALERHGFLAGFSNWGPGLAFSAPGQSIGTTDRTGSAGYNSSDYATVSGTSFASPYSAGVAALMLSLSPSMSAELTEQLMQATCVDLGDPGYDETFGWGFVNARAAVDSVVVPDCPIADRPEAETVVIAKNRYFGFVPGNAGEQVAFRVSVVSLPDGFEGCEGDILWVGMPREVTESPGSADPTPPPASWVASLSETPVYRDWGSIDEVFVYGKAVLPSAFYAVQAVREGCDLSNAANYSPSLGTSTSLWGDVVGDTFVGGMWSAPQGTIDFNDITAEVDKFKNAVGAPVKARSDLAGDTPDQVIDFNDISEAVEVFKGGGYPFAGPTCP